MHVALYARVSTADKDQNPETQLRPLREHLLHLQGATDAGAFVDHASADNLRGRKEWRRLLGVFAYPPKKVHCGDRESAAAAPPQGGVAGAGWPGAPPWSGATPAR